MARPATIPGRIHRIHGKTNLLPLLSFRKKIMVIAGFFPLVFLSAGWTLQGSQTETNLPMRIAVPSAMELQSAQAAPAPAPAHVPAPPASRMSSSSEQQQFAVGITTDKGSYLELSGDMLTFNGLFGQVIMSGDSLTTNTKQQKSEQSEESHGNLKGSYIWFQQDGKSYHISDAALVERAEALFRPIDEISHKQREIGIQQGKLGQKQAKLAVQRRSGLAARTDAGETQSSLAARQTELGEEQSQLAAEQRRIASEALDELRTLVADGLRKGSAIAD